MPRLLTALLCLGVLAGCKDEAAEQQRLALQAIIEPAENDAVALVTEAEQGFVPADQVDPSGERMRLQAYRNEKIQGVIKALAAQSRSGHLTREVRSANDRLLAGYYSSSARFEVRAATSHWAELANKNAHLLGHMMAIDRADARVQLLSTDEAVLIEELRESLREYEIRRDKLKAAVQQFEADLSELDTQMQQLGGEKQQKLLEASQMRRKAFVEKEQKKLELEKQASHAKRQATKIEEKLQLLALKRDGLQSTYNIDQKQRDLYAATSQWMEQQIGQTEQRQKQGREMREHALQQKQKLSEQMYEGESGFEQLQGTYTDNVEKKLDDASEVAKRAIDVLGASDLDKVAAQLTHLYVLTQHIIIAGNYGRTLYAIADQAHRLVPKYERSLRQTADGIRSKQDELSEKAGALIAEAKELATQLSDGEKDDADVIIATRYGQYVENYKKRIKDVRIERVSPSKVHVGP